MGLRDAIVEIANENAGTVTVHDIRRAGYTADAIRHYVRRHDDVERIAQGVYEFVDPDNILTASMSDRYLMSVLRIAGPDSYLAGESVLDFYNLSNANPHKVLVRSPHRLTRQIPGYMSVELYPGSEPVDVIRGIRLQGLYNAFLTTKSLQTHYLLEGIETAANRNLITEHQSLKLKNLIEGGSH